jgi:hypothetical protein
MRELKTLELEAVSGAARAPAPVPTTILGVRLGKKGALILAAFVSLLRPRPRPAE